MADAENKQGETSKPPKLPLHDPADKDSGWVRKLSQADQLSYLKEQVSWQEAKVKFEAAQLAAAKARDQHQAAFDALKTKYQEALNAKTAAMTEAAKLKARIDTAQAALKAEQADDQEQTDKWVSDLQKAVQDYAKQAAEVAKAKGALDQAQAALTAAGQKQPAFDAKTIELNHGVRDSADHEYDLALAAAGQQMDSALTQFNDARTKLQTPAQPEGGDAVAVAGEAGAPPAS